MHASLVLSEDSEKCHPVLRKLAKWKGPSSGAKSWNRAKNGAENLGGAGLSLLHAAGKPTLRNTNLSFDWVNSCREMSALSLQ